MCFICLLILTYSFDILQHHFVYLISIFTDYVISIKWNYTSRSMHCVLYEQFIPYLMFKHICQVSDWLHSLSSITIFIINSYLILCFLVYFKSVVALHTFYLYCIGSCRFWGFAFKFNAKMLLYSVECHLQPGVNSLVWKGNFVGVPWYVQLFYIQRGKTI